MRTVFVVSSFLVASSCASSPPPTERGAGTASIGDCRVMDTRAVASSLPLASVADCDRPGAVRAARLLQPSRAALFKASVSITLVDLRGPRAWAGIQRRIDEFKLLLGVCFQRWSEPSAQSTMAIVASIRASGAVRSIRTERKDGLGRCVADVLKAVEFSPQGLHSVSTEILASVSFRPSPWTLWAAK